MNGYPITLVDLAQARCVVVGGGQVAARKVADLRAAGARPVVVSPALCAPLETLAAGGEIEAVRRPYRPGDLAGARLAIAATGDPAANEAVWREARAAGCLVNVVDDPAHCTFHVPATVRRGPLSVAVSTAGHSPALARRLRREIERRLDAAYEPYVALLGELRALLRERIADPARRATACDALLDSNLLHLFREGRPDAARRLGLQLVDNLAGEEDT